jgi:hypothetical protein
LIAVFISSVQRTSFPFLIFLIVIAVWFAARAIGSIDVFDSGNYHLPVIRWYTSYPIVRGLGNIDGHFAFNSAYLLYQAMLELGFWQHRSSHIGNGLLLLVLMLFCVAKTRRVFLEGKVSDIGLLYPAVLVTSVLVMLPLAATPSTDLPGAVILLVITWCLLKFTPAEGFYESSTNNVGFHLFVGTILCAVAISIKLSNIFYAGCALLVFLIFWLRRRCGFPYSYRLRVAGICCLVVVGIGGVWVTRSVLLSGYPLFPSLSLKAPVSWRIPEVYADWYRWWIITWARTQTRDYVSEDGLAWIATWITGNLWAAKTQGILPLSLITASVIYLVVQWRKNKIVPFRHDVLQALSWLPAAVAIPAWFFIAPHLRFGSGILWAAAAQSVALAFWTLSLLNRPRTARVVLVCVSTMPFIVLSHQTVVASRQFQGSIAAGALSVLWTSPGPDYGLHPVYRSSFERVITSYGVLAYQPRERDCGERRIEPEKWRDCVMWNGPIPGAQRISENLAYLEPDNIAAGFVIREPDSSWAERHSGDVLSYQRRHSSNIRQLAFHFRVSPKTIRAALAVESDAAMVR